MRRALWAVVTMLALVSVACADGTDEPSNDVPMAGTTAGGGGMGGGGAGGQSGMGATSCGDGVVEFAKNEQCEPNVDAGVTCESMQMGTGMVVCNASCRLFMMCTGDQPVGGNGSNGMGGNGS